MQPPRRRWLPWTACFALLLLWLQYTPSGQTVTNRIVYLAAGNGTKLTGTAEGAFVPLDVALIDPNTNAKLLYTSDPTHDSTAGTQGPQLMIVGSSTPPTAVTTGRAVRAWGGLNGQLYIEPTYSGVFQSVGVGAAGTGTPRTVDVSSATIGGAPPTQGAYMAGVGSGATAGLVVPVTVCDSTGWLDMASATTTEIVPLVASRTVRVCSILVTSNGTSTVTLKRGTGTNCGTGTTSVSPAHELTAQTGWQEGTGVGEIIGPSTATGVGGVMTAGNALCVTSSGAVNVHVKVRFAVF